VNEWIALVKHREPDAKILVVATHGGPKARQPDIDRQEIWDLFGKEMVLDFFLVESKPDERTQEQKVLPTSSRPLLESLLVYTRNGTTSAAAVAGGPPGIEKNWCRLLAIGGRSEALL
jgi:hypothetical protein